MERTYRLKAYGEENIKCLLLGNNHGYIVIERVKRLASDLIYAVWHCRFCTYKAKEATNQRHKQIVL